MMVTGNQVFQIGTMFPDQMPQFLPRPQPQSSAAQLFLTLDLDWHLIHRIEEHRSGDLHFNIMHQTLCAAVDIQQNPVSWQEPISESDYVYDHGQYYSSRPNRLAENLGRIVVWQVYCN
jgi:hypothetical protein